MVDLFSLPLRVPYNYKPWHPVAKIIKWKTEIFCLIFFSENKTALHSNGLLRQQGWQSIDRSGFPTGVILDFPDWAIHPPPPSPPPHSFDFNDLQYWVIWFFFFFVFFYHWILKKVKLNLRIYFKRFRCILEVYNEEILILESDIWSKCSR